VITLSAMIRRAALLATLLVAAMPAVAAGQGTPFAPLPPSQQAPTVTVAPPPAGSSSDDGLNTWQQILMFGGGAVLLIGIGLVIVRDARQAAPVKAGEPATSGSTRRSRQRERERARAKAKAARRQRRRNR
jgi:hypothetical protein